MTLADKFDLMQKTVDADHVNEFIRLITIYPECRYNDDGSDFWLKAAADVGSVGVIKYLVSIGVNVNEPSNPSDSVPSPEGAISNAVNRGHLEAVRCLLDHGAVVNHMVNGRIRCQALVGAAIWGHLEIAKLLVERGAEVNAIWAQMTPLDRAIQHMRPEIEEYLRSVGGKTAMEVDPEAAAPPKKKGRGKR